MRPHLQPAFQLCAPGVCRIALAWSNAYLLTEEGRPDAWLIDTGLASDRSSLLAALAECGIAIENITAVVLTHGHCDHAGSVAFFQRTAGSVVYAHEAELKFLKAPRVCYGPTGMSVLRRPAQWVAFHAGELLFPVERLENCTAVIAGETLHAPGGDLEVHFTPGHSAGHISLLRRSDSLLFSGDAILNIRPHIMQRLRREGLGLPVRLFSADWDLVKQSAVELTSTLPRVLASGHGPVISDSAAERLATWSTQELRAGRTQ